MVERRPLLDLLAHAIMVLGMLIVAFHLPKPEAGKKQEEPKDAKK